MNQLFFIGSLSGCGSHSLKLRLVPSTWAGHEGLAQALQAHVKSVIAPFQYPRWIEFRDSLPKTATGKIQRYKLREEEAKPQALRHRFDRQPAGA